MGPLGSASEMSKTQFNSIKQHITRGKTKSFEMQLGVHIWLDSIRFEIKYNLNKKR